MLYAKHMWDTAAVTGHSEESANAFERHMNAQSLLMHCWHYHGGVCTATEHAATAALPTVTAAATAAEQTEAATEPAATARKRYLVMPKLLRGTSHLRIAAAARTAT